MMAMLMGVAIICSADIYMDTVKHCRQGPALCIALPALLLAIALIWFIVGAHWITWAVWTAFVASGALDGPQNLDLPRPLSDRPY